MSRHEKLLALVLRGTSDAPIALDDLRFLPLRLGFEERTRGSRHIFRRDGIEGRVNLQRDGSNAKPYLVEQVRGVILTHRLANPT